MASVQIIDAFRNKHVPERFLSTSTASTLEMFENQICVCLRAQQDALFLAKYEAEDVIRATFLARLDEWVREFPTEGTWSVVSHGTTHGVDGTYNCVLGFVFARFDDSENFLKHFLIVEKLTN